jgi:hypothetical protein
MQVYPTAAKLPDTALDQPRRSYARAAGAMAGRQKV